MKKGDEVRFWAGSYRGKLGRILRVWREGSHIQVRINNECLEATTPKVVSASALTIRRTDAIYRLAQIA